jgi:hypothetical protein
MTIMLWLVMLLAAALQVQAAPVARSSAGVAPDLFWCPMHPNVRSAASGACPICRMALVPIPAPHIGEYRMEVTPLPAPRGRLSGLRIRIGYPDTGAPLASLFPQHGFALPPIVAVHEQPLHLFIVHRDLAFFAHVHPERRPDNTFEVRHDIPAGEYMVIADFLPEGGTPQTVQRAIVTPGYDLAARPRAVPGPSAATAVTATDVKVTMDARDLLAGKVASLRFTIADPKTGGPVADLEPYLAAPAHALLASSDLTFVAHGHPEGTDAGGPIVSFQFLVPAPGLYKVWLQVQRRGRVQTLPFVFEVK